MEKMSLRGLWRMCDLGVSGHWSFGPVGVGRASWYAIDNRTNGQVWKFGVAVGALLFLTGIPSKEREGWWNDWLC